MDCYFVNKKYTAKCLLLSICICISVCDETAKKRKEQKVYESSDRRQILPLWLIP